MLIVNTLYMLKKALAGTLLLTAFCFVNPQVSSAQIGPVKMKSTNDALLIQIKSLLALISELQVKISTQKTNGAWEKMDGNTMFSIEHPKDWPISWNNTSFMFGKSKEDDFKWKVEIVEKKSKTAKDVTDAIGEQFKDRKVTKETISLRGTPATLVTVTTKSHPDWKAITVIVDGDKKYYPEKLFVISNGATEDKNFERFYKSFTLKEPKRLWLQSSAVTAYGSLSVDHVSGYTYKLSGTLYPPENCTGTEQYEFILDLKDGASETFTLENCEQREFSKTVTYSPSLYQVYLPELKLRYVDTNNNVWAYQDQARYKVSPTNSSSPTIEKINVNGAQKG